MTCRSLLPSLAAGLFFFFGLAAGSLTAAEGPALKLQKHDKIVIIGNTLAERMQYYNHWETLLHNRFPELELTVRNLGWSADELTLRPRSQDFQDHGHNLTDHKPNVILAMFGFNESFKGEKGLAKFEADLAKFIDDTTSSKYDGKAPPRLVVFSPIAHENLGKHELPDGKANNKNIALYTTSMKKICGDKKVTFVDLYAPSLKAMDSAGKNKLTINGVHLNNRGDEVVAAIIDTDLFGAPSSNGKDLKKLHAEVAEKNQQFFYDYRAVNGFYIYGGRKNPFGVINFPAEFAKLRKMIEVRDQRIWNVAQGKKVADQIDDSKTGEFVKIETNKPDASPILASVDSMKQMKVPEGYEVNVFASDKDFPDLEKPVQFCFDAKGRLWVATTPSYPQYIPGVPVNDKILIFEDTDGDGKADKQTVFADKLYLPIGIELADGGCYVSAQPNLMFLKDTDGDDKADVREILLSGFDSADSHHSISAFTWDQGGALYFEEGTFHNTQVETPYGPVRVNNAATFRWEPRTWRFDVFISYGYANPWGICVDRWNQIFIADASGGANYWATPFSGDVDFPNKHGNHKQFLKMQWRPTAGCEIVSSRNFPDDVQGNYLLNNCIGFQGTLQYKMREEDSGFAADPIEPLLDCKDPAFRPTDLEFGPDGALYICDWYNPLVGHMQHNIRDPQRDHAHGRIYRIHNTKKPLVKKVEIVEASIPQLFGYFITEPEERTRQHVRNELRNRDTQQVLAEAKKWLAGLDKKDAEYEHHKLEVLWLHEQHDMVDTAFLDEMLASPEPKARAAAVRVLCYWRDRVESPLTRLQKAVNDDHPRVRCEAVRALSFFNSQEAIDIANESLIYPQDDYLTYVLKETLNTLEPRVKRAGN